MVDKTVFRHCKCFISVVFMVVALYMYAVILYYSMLCMYKHALCCLIVLPYFQAVCLPVNL